MTIKLDSRANGSDCGSGYDVDTYTDSASGKSVAQVYHLPTHRVVYIDLAECQSVMAATTLLADGIGVPAENDRAAERDWDRMNAVYDYYMNADYDD